MADPLSILQTVDLCFKWGGILIEVCSAFVHAERELVEQVVRVRNYWVRAEVQLKLVRSIAHTLEEEHQKIQNETLDVLANKLKITVGIIKSVTKDDSVRRAKYALLQKKIENAIRELEGWQQMFDPSWYLIMKAATSQIDSELKMYNKSASPDTVAPISSAQALRRALNPEPASTVPIFLQANGLESLQIRHIPCCSAQLGMRNDPTKSLILERFDIGPGGNVKQVERDVRDLARKLTNCNPLEFGLFNCKGVVKHYDGGIAPDLPSAFTFIFRMPPGFSGPRSLRSCLQGTRTSDSLSDRFRLANELARSVGYVHTFGFVHKNIRPETIFLLQRNEDSSTDSAFLLGFDSFRTAEGKTSRSANAAWERCLYQHPSRMGSVAKEDYIMQHDIYSLGVCLLELGMWESFIEYDSKGDISPTSRLGEEISPQLFKETLLSMARRELKSRMGTMYSEVVETCLTSLDPGNADFGDESEFQDEDGIQVGVRYIEKVTMRLSNISV
ncbi:hypothetical protein ARAM_002631 [Aspergillus rambellii]|uniref:Protein kinase domain-containing protein n=1 Tax=Aspergillus rambellii TaxID=308745 RepID=A0A0F8UPB0_9EURO|nr:hypothetical protein ARAM_002631 [Aspergillus rambellii]